MEKNQTLLLQTIDISEGYALHVIEVLDEAGLGSIKTITVEEVSQEKNSTRFYVEDDEGKTFFLSLSYRGGFGELRKDGPTGTLLYASDGASERWFE